jgi:hypothetical protein
MKIISKIYIVIIIFSFLACKKDIDPIADNNYIQPAPNGNHLIIQEILNGISTQENIYIKCTASEDGNVYYYRIKNGLKVIGKQSFNGALIWEVPVNFTVHSIKTINLPYANLEQALLLTGDNNNRGTVALYKKDGTFLSDIIFNDYPIVNLRGAFHSECNPGGLFSTLVSENVNIGNRQTYSDYNLFIAFGAAGNSISSFAPYTCFFMIDSQGNLTKGTPNYYTSSYDKLYTQYPNQFFNEAISLFPPNNLSGESGWGRFSNYCNLTHSYNANPTKYITMYSVDAENKIKNFSLLKLNEQHTLTISTQNCQLLQYDINYVSNVDWNTEIKPVSNLYKSIIRPGSGSLLFAVDGFYIFGSQETINNKISSTDGNYLLEGLVSKINIDGSIAWKTPVNISSLTDVINCGIYDENNIYAFGMSHGGYNQDTIMGYGFATKINSQSGAIISSAYIGNEYNQSSFYCVSKNNSTLYLGGYKERSDKTSNSAKGWWVEFNKNGL